VPPPEPPAPSRGAHAVTAPLTGVFYRSPTPSAEPYVREGGPVSSGQVIGLIEAMKLFNEIKSDVTGPVRRLVAGDGDLVKARQTLIEVDPA
jgi:acetyl-CoA carboxylase biotin carboxyl carrier protein